MEIIIAKQSLLSGLSRMTSIADRKSSMQILSNVLIEASNLKNVRISSTDLNISATGIFPAQVIGGGAITVPAKTLHDIVRSVPDGPINIKTEGDAMYVSLGKTSFRLLGLTAEDFPHLQSAERLEFFDIDASLLASMIAKTFFSISSDETRPHLNGALFQGDGKVLRMVTTDGHRLSKSEVRLEKGNDYYNFSFVIPYKGVAEIRRLVEDDGGIVSIAVDEGAVFLRKEIEIERPKDGSDSIRTEFALISKLIESDFPPYDQVIPKGQNFRLLISRSLFLDALKRVSIVSLERTLGIEMHIKKNAVELVSDNPSVGQGKEQIDVSYDGNPFSIGFNARYFMDVLGVLECDEISLGLSGPLDPIVIRDDIDTFIGVIMPMRI